MSGNDAIRQAIEFIAKNVEKYPSLTDVIELLEKALDVESVPERAHIKSELIRQARGCLKELFKGTEGPVASTCLGFDQAIEQANDAVNADWLVGERIRIARRKNQ